MANIIAESETELLTSKSEPKIAENESMSNVNGASSDAKGSAEKSEEQVSTQATIDTEKGDAPVLPSESNQSDSLEREPMEAETSNDEPSAEKENVEKSPAERLKNIYNLEFNSEGGLCDSTDKSKRFDFNYYATHHKNQDRYDKIGNIVTEIIYDKMEKELGLQRVYIGEEKPGEKRSFFFASAAILDEEKRKEEKLLIIIHGSGAVRAGQWARSIIINDDRGLERGTQLPYIERAQKLGLSVIVTNTNENYDRSDGWDSERYEHSESPEKHAEYVWEKYARHADRIAIVAHSYGGVVVTRLAEKYHQDFDEKVFAIALTDSVHGGSMGTHAKRIFANRAQNWVTSDEKLDTPLTFCGWGNSEREDAFRVSAGHTRHEWTSHACITSVFAYFAKKLLPTPSSSAAAPGEKGDQKISNEKQNDDENNGDNNMDDGANCLGSSSASAAAGDLSDPKSAAVETCAGSSNTNCTPLELREAGDGAAAVPLEPSEPYSGDPENRLIDGEGEGQPRDSNDNGASPVMSVLEP